MTRRYLTVDEVAELLRTTPATVRHWRFTKRGPEATKVGRRVLYEERAVLAWIDAQQAAPEVSAS